MPMKDIPRHCIISTRYSWELCEPNKHTPTPHVNPVWELKRIAVLQLLLLLRCVHKSHQMNGKNRGKVGDDGVAFLKIQKKNEKEKKPNPRKKMRLRVNLYVNMSPAGVL